jgi:magnesium transporter
VSVRTRFNPKEETVIVDCAYYRDGQRQHEGAMELDRAAEICMREPGGFVWLGLFEPSPDELSQVQDRFGLHDLAVEDAQSYHLRPKIEHYDEGVYFAVLRTAHYAEDREEVEFGEVSVFMSEHFVITVRQGVASELHEARLRLEGRPELLREGSASVLWAILDQIVDDYAPVIEGVEHDVEEVEATVFSGAAAPTRRIYLLRREATEFYRAVHPLLAPLDALERGTYQEIGAELRPFFRDVNDHLKLINEEVAALRDVLAVVLQANMAVISVQENEATKRLTVVATIFLPLSFVVGFFGMNFGWLTGHTNSLSVFLLYGVGSLVACCGVLYVLVSRSGYLDSERSAQSRPH